eukprot:g8697.t1
MGFAGQPVVDALILAGAASLTAIGCMYLAMMWRLRSNFFIVLRSPLLAIAFGAGVTLRYMVSTYEDVIIWQEDEGTVDSDGVIDLIGFPATVAAEIALVMSSVRLLVMYYPRKRTRWGRYIKEKLLIRALGFALLAMEIAVWSAAYSEGVARTAAWISRARPVSVFVLIVAAVVLACQLRHVHDSTNLSRDTGMVGRVLTVLFVPYVAVELSPISPLVYKYVHVAFLAVSHPPLVYLIVIRPVREVLRPAPVRRRSCFEAMLAPRCRRAPVSTVGDMEQPAALVDSNQLPTIMSLPPLRKAFGEFCRKALCSESFEFLHEVAKFKNRAPGAGAGNDAVTDSFVRYRIIVNNFIKYDSHSEVNISADIKREVMDFIKFEAYLLLNPEERKNIFDIAEGEIKELLRLNLVGKFLDSEEYMAAVGLQRR